MTTYRHICRRGQREWNSHASLHTMLERYRVASLCLCVCVPPRRGTDGPCLIFVSSQGFSPRSRLTCVILLSARWISESPEGHASEGYGRPVLTHPAPESDMETGSRRGVERYPMELSSGLWWSRGGVKGVRRVAKVDADAESRKGVSLLKVGSLSTAGQREECESDGMYELDNHPGRTGRWLPRRGEQSSVDAVICPPPRSWIATTSLPSEIGDGI